MNEMVDKCKLYFFTKINEQKIFKIYIGLKNGKLF